MITALANLQSYALAGQVRSEIAAPLQRTLRQLGVAEVERSAASVVVNILDQRSRRRSVSTSGQARAAEYELDYSVLYQLEDGSGNALGEPVWIERQRVYRIDRGNIVGSNQEQTLLRREILDDAAGQIVRALALVSRTKQDTQQEKVKPRDAGQT